MHTMAQQIYSGENGAARTQNDPRSYDDPIPAWAFGQISMENDFKMLLL
jgi:hypothetical protein